MDQTPPAPTPPHAPHGAGGRRIVREPDDRKIAGVCSGLADHLGIDVAVMGGRGVVLAIVTPAALIAYLVASVAIPERRPDQPRVRARHVHLGQVPHPLIAVGAVVAAPPRPAVPGRADGRRRWGRPGRPGRRLAPGWSAC